MLTVLLKCGVVALSTKGKRTAQEMETEMFAELEAETNQAIIAISAIAAAKGMYGFGAVNFSLAACEAAAEITGCDPAFCKMLNRQFRDDAAAMMFEMAAA